MWSDGVKQVGTYADIRRLPLHGLSPRHSCPRLVLFFTSYPFGIMTPIKKTGTKYRGLSPHKITPIVGRTAAKDAIQAVWQWKSLSCVLGAVRRSPRWETFHVIHLLRHNVALWFLYVALGHVATRAHAECSTFAFKTENRTILAHNFDYPQEIEDGLLFINHPVATKRAWRSNFMQGWSADPASELERWTSRYGSVTFNLPGFQMVSAGMNTEGLSVATMELKETRTPNVAGRPHIESTVWLQFILDTCADVGDVCRRSQRFTVDGFSHFLFADATGQTAIVEWVDGRMVISIGGADSCVLTNSTFAESNQTYGTVQNKLPGIPATDRWRQLEIEPDDWTRSLERYCILREVLGTRSHEIENPVEFAFDTLKKAKFPVPDREGEFRTQWSVVFDTETRVIHFETRLHTQRRRIEFDGIDFRVNRSPAMYFCPDARSWRDPPQVL
ncbi:carcinine hydrolase/isopenicillin-N N-acyltransferase family protein [Novipirellula artificiosorum]|uniref:Acyl-coenzyme A:6-aminopenicillanic acid acyl-transferase n=1 Tax=Novipirellula artificiosorum TaxID=2528016 RepID=A0A5C6D5X7_9BACT|nr:carcinine hydrolase/isopenicillin-N N-acyltransferase family protein [Novipirellula artificiosorum]TWU31107.1 Acyl-coenzyme A:6-aminopenicillanic acid acyl-transferase [Novipirellula artificiosorum]